MFAAEGYADLLLADIYCSGVPLSTLEFEKDFTYKPGSSTSEVYRTAAALFDTAITLSLQSVRVNTFARVGRGRALLAAGQFDSAARVVAPVPDTATYSLRVKLDEWNLSAGIFGTLSVSDHEGINGLLFQSGNDPRTRVTTSQVFLGFPATLASIYSPTMYDPALNGDSVTMVLASGVEARLIQAEADLRRGAPSWLTTLNALRTDGTAIIGASDTTWNPGTGGVAGLAPLDDPGTDSARVTLLFHERAFWLFATAHRQGDLRRLVRATAAGGYGRDPEQAYPTGISQYGRPYETAVNLRIPPTESPNPYFKGCLSHE